MPFDATPATGVGGSVSPVWAPNPSPPQTSDPNVDTDVQHPGQASTDPSAGPLGAQPGGADPTGGSAASAVDPKVVAYTAGGGLALLLVVLLLLTPALSRSRQRRRRLRFSATTAKATVDKATATGPGGAALDAADPLASVPPGLPVVLPPDDAVYQAARANAHQAWDELLDTMTDYQVEIDEAETPRATGVRLIERERLRDDAASGVRLLGSAEERARYALRPITGQELRSSLGAVRSALSARSSRRIRIMAVLLPPSVVQRWKLSTWRRFTDIANAVGGRRDAVVRTLSVRRMVTRRAKT